jgi:hypothetical protein
LRFTDVSAQLFTGIHALARGAAAMPTGTDEVQTLTITGTGGTYQLRVTVGESTQTTTALAFDANAAAIQAALNALSNLADGDIVITGTNPFALTGAGNLADLDILPIVVLPASLTGGSASIGQTTAGAGRFHEITNDPSDDVAKTSFIIGTEGDDDEPSELYKGMCVNRIVTIGEIRGKVSMAVEFCGHAEPEIIDPFDFPACNTLPAVYTNDCQWLVDAVDRTSDLRRFQNTFNNNLAINDDPFVFDAVDAVRIERGEQAEESIYSFQVYGTKAHPLYVAAKAESALPMSLRIGTATEGSSLIAAGAQFALTDEELGYAGEANRSVINLDVVPFSINGAAPDRVSANLDQQDRFLVAPA